MFKQLPSEIHPDDLAAAEESNAAEATPTRTDGRARAPLLTRLIKNDLPSPLRREVARLAAVELLTLYDHPRKDRDFRKRLRAELAGVHQTRKVILPPPEELTLRERHRRRTVALLAFLSGGSANHQLEAECCLRLGTVAGPEAIPVLERIARRGSATVWAAAKTAISRIQRAHAMTIVLASMEVKPYSGAGGLGNVMEELPKALVRAGHRVIVLTPRHANIDRTKLENTRLTGQIVNPEGSEPFQLLRDVKDGVEIYFIENDKYFSANRTGIYGDDEGPFGDNDMRYDFFGAAIPQALRKILNGAAPDIIQLNDAHTSTAAVYLRHDRGFERTKVVMAIHNLGAAYQARFPAHCLDRFCFDKKLYGPAGPAEFYGEVNLLKLGLLHADAAICVSRQYMKECLSPERGEGLHGVLQQMRRAGKLWGNLNGIDTEVWNPETDPMLEHHFGPEDPAGKLACKTQLQERFGLELRPDVPVIGVLGRLAWQKGWEDTMRAIEHVIGRGHPAQFVLCGAGGGDLAHRLREIAERFAGQVAFDNVFTPEREHLIYAGSDLFLMPSRFEPCGLPQMYALRYQTVPIVRAVGGLDESIKEYDPEEGTGNGFKFSDDVTQAVDRALEWYDAGPEHRQELLELCARCDFSWASTSAPEQLAFYRDTLFGQSSEVWGEP